MSWIYRKSLRFLGILSVSIGIILMIVVMNPGFAFATENGNPGQNGTTLNVSKTADTDCSKVFGTISVNNGGAVATQGITIVDNLQGKSGSGSFQTIASENISSGEIPAGSTQTYNYQINFPSGHPAPGWSYRNEVRVTIYNHSGSIGDAHTTKARASFSVDKCFVTTTTVPDTTTTTVPDTTTTTVPDTTTTTIPDTTTTTTVPDTTTTTVPDTTTTTVPDTTTTTVPDTTTTTIPVTTTTVPDTTTTTVPDTTTTTVPDTTTTTIPDTTTTTTVPDTTTTTVPDTTTTTTSTTTTVPDTTTTTVPDTTTTTDPGTTTTTIPDTTTTTVSDGGTTTTTIGLQIAGITTIEKRSKKLQIAGISTELPFTGGGLQDIGFIAGGASSLFGSALLFISSRRKIRFKHEKRVWYRIYKNTK